MQPRERLEPPGITPLERQLLFNTTEQKRPNIQAVPKSSVLSKLKTFLPQMQQANAELQQKLETCDPAEVDIEHIPENTGTDIIQMDLACGLLELRDNAAVAAAQRAIAAGCEVAVETYDGGSSSSSDSDTDSEDSSSSDNDEAVAAAGTADTANHTCSMEGAEAVGSIQQQEQQHKAAPAVPDQPQHQQQQQGPAGRRRKVKAKRPMIVELQSG